MSLGFNHHGAITRSFCASRITLVCICLVYGFPGATWATSLGHHPQVKEATPQQEAPGPSVIAQKGPLEEIKGPLQELTDFASVEGRLELKMKASYQEAIPTVNRIRELGGWGGNSSSSGSGRFSFHMDGNKLAGVIKRGPVEGGIENSILLEEKSQPFRKFEISGTTLGTISINIKSTEPHYLLRLRQLSDGQILVQEIDQDQMGSQKEETKRQIIWRFISCIIVTTNIVIITIISTINGFIFFSVIPIISDNSVSHGC